MEFKKEVNWLAICFSRIFDIAGKILIGRRSLMFSGFDVLGNGKILARFHRLG